MKKSLIPYLIKKSNLSFELFQIDIVISLTTQSLSEMVPNKKWKNQWWKHYVYYRGYPIILPPPSAVWKHFLEHEHFLVQGYSYTEYGDEVLNPTDSRL